MKSAGRTHPAEATAKAGYEEIIKGRLKCRPWYSFGTNRMIVCHQKFIMHHLMPHFDFGLIHLFSLNHMQYVESLCQIIGFDLNGLHLRAKLPY